MTGRQLSHEIARWHHARGPIALMNLHNSLVDGFLTDATGAGWYAKKLLTLPKYLLI